MSTLPSITLEGDGTVTAIISLGSNLPSAHAAPSQTLQQAWRLLDSLSVSPGAISSFYRTEPVDCEPGTPTFINAVALIYLPRGLAAAELLQRLLGIEAEFGRLRGQAGHESRPLDLDLICCGGARLQQEGLILPHPRAHQRRFVLEPLAELAPDLILPGQSEPVRTLLSGLPDTHAVRRIPLPG